MEYEDLQMDGRERRGLQKGKPKSEDSLFNLSLAILGSFFNCLVTCNPLFSTTLFNLCPRKIKLYNGKCFKNINKNKNKINDGKLMQINLNIKLMNDNRKTVKTQPNFSKYRYMRYDANTSIGQRLRNLLLSLAVQTRTLTIVA